MQPALRQLLLRRAHPAGQALRWPGRRCDGRGSTGPLWLRLGGLSADGRLHAVERTASSGAGAASTLELRDYQKTAVEAVITGFEKKMYNRQLLALPTGAGKTVVFIEIAKRLNCRTLVLVNRKELLDQTMATLERVWPGEVAGRVQGRKQEISSKVVVSTIQTASHPSKIRMFSEQGFQLLIIDEAHHAPADTYMTLMRSMGFLGFKSAPVSLPDPVPATQSHSTPDAVAPVAPTLHPFPATAPTDQCTPEPACTLDLLLPPASDVAAVVEAEVCEGEPGQQGPVVAVEGSALSSDERSSGVNDTSPAWPPSAVPCHHQMESTSTATPIPSARAPAAGVAGMDRCSSGADNNQGSGSGNDSDGDSMDGADSSLSVSRPAADVRWLLGVTATPYRLNGEDEMGEVFETTAYQQEIQALIKDGYLSEVKAVRIMTYSDLSSLATAQDDDGEGDFQLSQLSKVVNTPARNQLVVDSYLRQAQGRKAVAFCCNIQHARDLTQCFKDAGVKADMITGELSAAERDAIRNAHKLDELEVLVNINLLTEGYDDASISCILMARPTKSTGLYTQCIGRGLRVHPGKQDCLVIDFTDNDHRLDKVSDVVTCEDLFKPGQGVQLINYEPMPREVTERTMRHILKGGHLQLYGGQRFPWIQFGADLFLQLWCRHRNQTVWIHAQKVPVSELPTAQKRAARAGQEAYCIRMLPGRTLWLEPLNTRGKPQGDPSEPGISVGTKTPQWTVIRELKPYPPDRSLTLVVQEAERVLESCAPLRKLGFSKEVLDHNSTSTRFREEPPTEKQLKLLEDCMKELDALGLPATWEAPSDKGRTSDMISLTRVILAQHQALAPGRDRQAWQDKPAPGSQAAGSLRISDDGGDQDAVPQQLLVEVAHQPAQA